MKKRNRILLGIATIWPIFYIGAFLLGMFVLMFTVGFGEAQSRGNSERVDLIQLEQKIRNRELKSLTFRGSELEATDRWDRRFYVQVTNESTRAELIRQGTELDPNGAPRVERVVEEPVRELPAIAAIGIVGFFAVHMFTVLLIMALTAFYIYLAVKSDRLDQTMKIVWTILIAMVGLLVMPAFWFLYVWRDPPVADSDSVRAQT